MGLLGRIMNVIRGVKGTTNWYDTPATTLQTAVPKASTPIGSGGSVSLASITYDANGLITAASSGSPGAISDATPSVKGAVFSSQTVTGGATALAVNDAVLSDFITGLTLSWTSATQIAVNPGAAWIQSQNRIINVPSTITVTPTKVAGWMHVYLYFDGTNPQIEVVTTAPAAPYRSTARSKTADTSRRWIGAILVNTGATAIYKFSQIGGWQYWLENTAAVPFLVLNDGRAITETTVSCAGCVPVSSKMMIANAVHYGTSNYSFGNSEDNIVITAPASNGTVGFAGSVFLTHLPSDDTSGWGKSGPLVFLLDSSQAFTYRATANDLASLGLVVGVAAFEIAR